MGRLRPCERGLSVRVYGALVKAQALESGKGWDRPGAVPEAGDEVCRYVFVHEPGKACRACYLGEKLAFPGKSPCPGEGKGNCVFCIGK